MRMGGCVELPCLKKGRVLGKLQGATQERIEGWGGSEGGVGGFGYKQAKDPWRQGAKRLKTLAGHRQGPAA